MRLGQKKNSKHVRNHIKKICNPSLMCVNPFVLRTLIAKITSSTTFFWFSKINLTAEGS